MTSSAPLTDLRNEAESDQPLINSVLCRIHRRFGLRATPAARSDRRRMRTLTSALAAMTLLLGTMIGVVATSGPASAATSGPFDIYLVVQRAGKPAVDLQLQRHHHWSAIGTVPGCEGASTVNGALVELWTCNGGSNQQWNLG